MSRDLLEALDERGLLEYGSVIPAVVVREILELEYPEVGTKAQFDRLSLAELSGIDYVRRVLLPCGKYLAGHQGDYRILTPSENQRQISTYMSQADKKIRRAMTLSKSTPAPRSADVDQTESRIMLKRDSVRRYGSGASAS